MALDSRPDWSGRLQRLRDRLVGLGAEALVVSTPQNIAYLSNYSGSSGLLVVAADRVTLITDGRYEFSVRERLASGQLAAVAVERVDRRYDLTLTAIVARAGWPRVAFEAGHVTVATAGSWQRAAPAVTWLPTEQLVESIRTVKDDWEVTVYRRAGVMLAGVAAGLSEIVRPGHEEREIAAAIDRAVERAGFARAAFPTIVASGPNSAHPHARPGSRRLVAGDLVVLDFGGVLDGYCVDLTRTAAVAPVAPQAHALHAAVRAAQEAALAAIRPGVESAAIDAAARGVLDGRGLGAAFLHSTGHGLGLDVHEAPHLARAESGVTQPLAPGMVIAIEPGAYVEGVGGVRVEDDVLVTASGCEVLTEASRDLLVV
jgi:Xaa-Pro aminopeptidase